MSSQRKTLLVTARAASNIAVIKYWGKRDVQLNLPLNSSLSVTLNPDHLAATTTVAVCSSFEGDRLWLNGKEVSLDSARYQICFKELRARAADMTDRESGTSISKEEWQRFGIHVASVNNFPTAAGLASSAAGFACLVFALAKLMGVKEAYPGELSTIARQGSGSACRSLDGGFVRWDLGKQVNGQDSIATQVAPEDHWPDLRIVIAVVSSKQKETSSTAGMQESVATSALLPHRAKEVVPERLRRMEAAVAARDFAEFARITCADSNQFHAVCLDTSPPIFYLTDTSRRVISVVERWNASNGTPLAAYTFDAGPNAVLFTRSANVKDLMHRILYHFPPPPGVPLSRYVIGDTNVLEDACVADLTNAELVDTPAESIGPLGSVCFPGELQYIICTTPGRGAHLVDDPSCHLLDQTTGLPFAP